MDDSDRAILGCLLRNARATYAQIGSEVGLSASAVKRRVDALTRRGVIRGFTVVIDPDALGWRTEAYVQLYCRGNVSPEALQRVLAEVPEVVSASTVSGSADALVHMVAADVRQLERAIERIRRAPWIEQSVSDIVLSRIIERPTGPQLG
ncbi:DNA-binding Lrp family transcriptional regulator [Microlunatus panaciterrae]|uniref:DNA-binding Lrp family transcriptional regulator n=1 Tax=Microlunatus panaciterrae TaxID=400768 RepID=A0ABS2RI81_9ACTN|nr:Lrp/AsnC family transcriptional regulator [Microlunatus panaciterrae]MBM7798699.1 DNA-binding Lrp family transcriptional regulator [Microlunatus panaciterrae]